VIEKNLADVEARIARAAARTGRARTDITLVAVSKQHPAELMREYQAVLARRGETPTFGENYVQEFKKKSGELARPFNCHLIGPLQRNKAKDAAKLFELIESVHDERIAQALNDEAQKIGRKLAVYLQINISGDPKKAGSTPENAAVLASFVDARCPFLSLEGLMAITRLYENPADARPDFRALRRLRDEISAKRPKNAALKLSMGMSADFEIAIEEGADVIRVGTALFGSR
jgi:pyridoxal phosphate enzyme (YggS family)